MIWLKLVQKSLTAGRGPANIQIVDRVYLAARFFRSLVSQTSIDFCHPQRLREEVTRIQEEATSTKYQTREEAPLSLRVTLPR